jgi:RNA polymerase sigma-70 factor (ECF subfamily)
MRELVDELTPVIRSSVAYVLSRATPENRGAHQEIEDVTQTVLLALFADRARSLLAWDPSRGVALSAFVAMLAKNEAVSLLRSARRSPWTELPMGNEDLDQNAASRMGPESETISRDMLEALAAELRERLTAKGFELFELMFVRALPLEEVCALTGISPESFYAWRSRLARLVKEVVADLVKGPPSLPFRDEGTSSGRVAHLPPSPSILESDGIERGSEPGRASEPTRESGETMRAPAFKSGPLPVVKRRGRAAG